jgi:hypothetical protein
MKKEHKKSYSLSSGYSYGSGDGYGYGYGSGDGCGDGYGSGSGYGDGYGLGSKVRNQIELNILSHIPDSDLPLFIGEWEFEETKKLFEQRLKS